MILILCTDDSNGMTFNNRRQSRDCIVRKHILADIADSKLWINQYSNEQFATLTDNIQVDEDFLSKAERGEYCFIENVSLDGYEEKIEKIIMYRWNRRYPADFFFEIKLDTGGWKLSDTEDFKGNSHDKITREVYTR